MAFEVRIGLSKYASTHNGFTHCLMIGWCEYSGEFVELFS